MGIMAFMASYGHLWHITQAQILGVKLSTLNKIFHKNRKLITSNGKCPLSYP